MVQIFDALITSKMRVHILMRLFLNPDNRAYLRELASEYEASPGHVNKELNSLRDAGLLRRERAGRQINYRANTSHPLFPELQSMVRKSLGMDRILDSIIERLGKLKKAYLAGDYAQGRDTGVIELVLVGEINRRNLDDLVAKTERYISREIHTTVLSPKAFDKLVETGDLPPGFLLWQSNGATRDE